MEKILLKAILFAALFVFPFQKTEALDPVTMGILMPVAVKAANKAAPYITRGFSNAGSGCMECAGDMLDIFRLPLGMGQVLLLGPFGYMNSGLKNIRRGALAPFKLSYHIVTFPITLIKGT